MRVLNDFTDNPELFEELLQDLRNYIAKDQKRNALVEKRVRDSESGKAKTQAFKATVQRMINQKASGLRLSPDLSHFVRDIWSRVLVYVCVKFGANGEEWRQAAETLDDLLWSAQPLTVMEDIERRDSTLPGLIERLHEGFSYINAGQSTHDMLARINATLEKISQHDRAFLDDKQLPSPRDDYEELEEVVLTAPTTTEVLENEPEPKYLELVEKLAEGAWVEMTTASGEPMRCKLATIVQPGDIYVFVNRRGMKVAERSMASLAADLQRESLTLLDESEVFDRALETVIGSLRDMHADASGQ